MYLQWFIFNVVHLLKAMKTYFLTQLLVISDNFGCFIRDISVCCVSIDPLLTILVLSGSVGKSICQSLATFETQSHPHSLNEAN